MAAMLPEHSPGRHVPYRLCLTTSSSPSDSLDHELATASEAGFSCVELWASVLQAYLACYPLPWLDLRLRQRAIHGLVVNGFGPLSIARAGSGEDASVNQARFLELCAHLDGIGGATIVLHPALGEGREESSREENVRALRAYADLAAPFEVVLAFEFRAASPVPDLEAAQDVVARAACSNLRLALSAREWRASKGEPGQIGDFDPFLLAAVHLGHPWIELDQRSLDDSPAAAQDSHTPVQTLRAHLARAGFRGPYCVSVLPERGSPLSRASAARQAALDLLTPLYAITGGV